MKKDKFNNSKDSLSTAFYLTIKRALRLRHRKSYLIYLIVLAILFVTFYLFSSLTSSSFQDADPNKSQSLSSDYLDNNNLQLPLVKPLDKEVVHSNKKSNLNPKFKHIQDQIPKSDDANQDENKVDGYGDRYALFKENVISNYETGEKLRNTKPGDLGIMIDIICFLKHVNLLEFSCFLNQVNL